MSDDEERLIGFSVVVDIVGVSRAEIHRRIAAGAFPIPIRDGPHANSRTLFLLSEIRQYVRAKIASRQRIPSK